MKIYVCMLSLVFSCLCANVTNEKVLPFSDENLNHSEAYEKAKLDVDRLVLNALNSKKVSIIFKKIIETFFVTYALAKLISYEKKYLKISDKSYDLQLLCVPMLECIMSRLFLDRCFLKNDSKIDSLKLLKEFLNNNISSKTDLFQEKELELILEDINSGITSIKNQRSLIDAISFMINFSNCTFSGVCMGIFAFICDKDFIKYDKLGHPSFDYGFGAQELSFLDFFRMPLAAIVVQQLFMFVWDYNDGSAEVIQQIELKINEIKASCGTSQS